MRTEKTLAAILIIALTLKLLNVPGTVLLLLCVCLCISILYFVFAFYFFSDQTIKNQKMGLSVVSGIVLSIAPMGILFKLLYWPGSFVQLFLAILAASIILVITLILRSSSTDDSRRYYKNHISRCVFWLILCSAIFLIPQETFLQIQYRNEPALAKLKIEAYSDPNNVELQQKLDRYQDSVFNAGLQQEQNLNQ